MLPSGRSSDAGVPVKIWSKTGTVGLSNETPLTRNAVPPLFCVFVGESLLVLKEEMVLTRPTVILMLMSAPPAVALPG
jgi:hypothetical protein